MMFRFHFAFVAIVGVALGTSPAWAQTATTDNAKSVRFDSDVSPIFKSHCSACHAGSVKLKELDLSTEEAAVKGSESGRSLFPANPTKVSFIKKFAADRCRWGSPIYPNNN